MSDMERPVTDAIGGGAIKIVRALIFATGLTASATRRAPVENAPMDIVAEKLSELLCASPITTGVTNQLCLCPQILSF